MADVSQLDRFEAVLEQGLLKICKSAGLIGEEIMDSPDVTSKWNDGYMKEYVADAVENFNDYPEAALAWAAFLGMGVARNWDAGWGSHMHDTYSSYYGSRGWDDMDEHILNDVLRLQPEYAGKVSDTLQSCALATLGLIRHEGIEAQTADGFYVLVRAYSVMYRLGAGIELYRNGYKKVRIK